MAESDHASRFRRQLSVNLQDAFTPFQERNTYARMLRYMESRIATIRKNKAHTHKDNLPAYEAELQDLELFCAELEIALESRIGIYDHHGHRTMAYVEEEYAYGILLNSKGNRLHVCRHDYQITPLGIVLLMPAGDRDLASYHSFFRR